MDDTQIVQACRDLVLVITQHGDHGEAEEAAALFAEGGTLIRGGREYTGEAELLAAYRDQPQSQIARHLNGGTVVEVLDEDHAIGVTYYLAYRHESSGEAVELPVPLGQPFSIGEWHDRFVRTPAGWRFSSRETKRVFVRKS
jgi:SnoaL-like protein